MSDHSPQFISHSNVKFPDYGLIGTQEQQERALESVRQFRELERRLAIDELAQAVKILQEQPSGQSEPTVCTCEAINYFFEVKSGKNLKDSTKDTYRKRLNQFAATFEFLPINSEVVRRDYLYRYDEMSVKYRLGHHDLLAEFYNVIKQKYSLKSNPIADIERPDPSGYVPKPNPLNSKWLPGLMQVVENDTELAALLMELGAGWRPREFRSIEAIDVRRALDREDPIIDCHSKELAKGQIEWAPILPEALEVLSRLTHSNLADHELIIRNRRIRSGVLEPMGERAHLDLIYSLYRRADIPNGFTPYSLRDTFATQVFKVSKNWNLVERLLRHRIQGQGKAYVLYPMDELCQDLQLYSPLRHINLSSSETLPVQGWKGSQEITVVETGEW